MPPAVLPNADLAFVLTDKLTGYCLDPSHPDGKHKARKFEAALGLTASDADWLRGRIPDAILTETAVQGEPTEYGERYVVDFEAVTAMGAATIRTAWIIRHAEVIPRLTSCYIP